MLVCQALFAVVAGFLVALASAQALADTRPVQVESSNRRTFKPPDAGVDEILGLLLVTVGCAPVYLRGRALDSVRSALAAQKHWARHVEDALAPRTLMRMHDRFIRRNQKLPAWGKATLKASLGWRFRFEPRPNLIK